MPRPLQKDGVRKRNSTGRVEAIAVVLRLPGRNAVQRAYASAYVLRLCACRV